MKISLITVTFNSEKYLEETILSVIGQTYKDIEYIIIDGGSTDNTIKIIEKFSKNIPYWKSEKDNGIYDAMNKGIMVSTGDVIGFINSDDVFYDINVVEKITQEFSKDLDCVYGNVVISNNNKIIRMYNSKNFKINQLRYGHMPPHPSFYAKKDLFLEVGLFNSEYKISADYDFILRSLLINHAKYKYIDMIFVRMRSGGISSTLKNKIILNKEILDSCKRNYINSNYLMIYSKYFFKLLTFLKWK